MSPDHLKALLEGYYVTIPTSFEDVDGLSMNEPALSADVRFLIDAGLSADHATFLAGGAAGDLSTMTFDEQARVASIVVDGFAGIVPVAMGTQTKSTLELFRLATTAKRLGAAFIQLSCPFYFTHTEGDSKAYVLAAADAEPDLGLIVYNTVWTSQNFSVRMIDRPAVIPNIVGLKWATPQTERNAFDVVSHFSDRFTIIDNNLYFARSAMPALGARAFEAHNCIFWPEWGIKLIDAVRARNFPEVARMLVKEAMPFHESTGTLWAGRCRYAFAEEPVAGAAL